MPNSTWNKNYGTLADGGSVYTETNIHHTIVEPWNAISSLAILLPAIYWAYKLRGRYKDFKVLTFCIPLLFLGGLGSTLFHAFRTSPFLLLLDFLPILILSLLVSFNLWLKVLKKWSLVIGLFIIIISIRYYVPDLLSHHDAINLRYFINGCMIFLPGLMLIVVNQGKGLYLFFLALICFSLALFCRKADALNPPLLAVGTHWIWHILTGIGTLFLSHYLYLVERISIYKRRLKLEEAVNLQNEISDPTTI